MYVGYSVEARLEGPVFLQVISDSQRTKCSLKPIRNFPVVLMDPVWSNMQQKPTTGNCTETWPCNIFLLNFQGWTKPNAFHVCITSYKLVVQDHQSFRRKKWKYLILDEVGFLLENLKNLMIIV